MLKTSAPVPDSQQRLCHHRPPCCFRRGLAALEDLDRNLALHPRGRLYWTALCKQLHSFPAPIGNCRSDGTRRVAAPPYGTYRRASRPFPFRVACRRRPPPPRTARERLSPGVPCGAPGHRDFAPRCVSGRERVEELATLRLASQCNQFIYCGRVCKGACRDAVKSVWLEALLCKVRNPDLEIAFTHGRLSFRRLHHHHC
ncbi:hypothetical protein E2C01_023377 [Portunus trituberculatus]|uniref:Uncharacterized protein n=1 Tax=Portunus trituberculatus TaxID=210409 RepID=A0A5B7E8N2_PORTR|nr:hypothetical protein [Portunus trituberculatus]